MKTEQTESGLIVPLTRKHEPKRPDRTLGPLEIKDAEKRRVAHTALVFLWEALDLEHQLHSLSASKTTAQQYAAYDQLYHYVGEMLLGEDCPNMPVLT